MKSQKAAGTPQIDGSWTWLQRLGPPSHCPFPKLLHTLPSGMSHPWPVTTPLLSYVATPASPAGQQVNVLSGHMLKTGLDELA